MSTKFWPQALRGVRYIHYFTGSLAILFLGLACINRYLFTVFQVDGHSMDTALHDKQLLLINKVGYAISSLKRNDIVIIYYSGDSSVHFVKRIIGLPNETITVEGRVWKLESDQYFVAGDNRAHSTDSRAYGPIKRSQIIGKVE